MMKRFLLVVKSANEQASALADTVRAWLIARECQATIIPSREDSLAYTEGDHDMVIVFGGDGTLLGVCRRMTARPKPILGVNFGRVGFLSSVQPEEWERALSRAMAGTAHFDSHMVLRWEVRRKDETLSGVAVNDVVICRGALSRLSNLAISINDEEICKLRADGLIISSPLGSTAYTLSAGGALLHPGLDALILTPICPFFYRMPPLVMPAAKTLKVALLSDATETALTADGQEGFDLRKDDIVVVSTIPNGVTFVLPEPDNYFRRLRRRGFLGRME